MTFEEIQKSARQVVEEAWIDPAAMDPTMYSDLNDALYYMMGPHRRGAHTSVFGAPFRVPIQFVRVDWGEAPDVIDVECKVIEPQKLLNP